MSCALAAAGAGAQVTLVTPGACAGPGSADVLRDDPAMRALAGGNTALAQGGIAAAIGAQDSPTQHAADTVSVGVGLVDAAAADVLTVEGAAAVRALLAAGFEVDRDPSGAPRLGLEAAHEHSRIVHAGGDRTGAMLHAFLLARVLIGVQAGRITLMEGRTAMSLISESGVVSGVVVQDPRGFAENLSGDAVVLATGGYAGLYPRTSNHAGARGEGVVLAARAGAAVADLEFVQFHPTVLAGSGELISEAVRGAGARLLDGAGHAFMADRHPRGDLAPRDVVSREIHRVLRERGDSCVWLDATHIERDGALAGQPGTLARRFPGISAAVAARGLDWRREPIPVSPAAHYSMGGVLSDLDGRSTVPGLYAVGEVAATGVHGANRLASNSLLEGLVFGARAGRAVAGSAARAARGDWQLRGEAARELARNAHAASILCPGHDADRHRESVSSALAAGLGIERDAAGLAAAGEVFAQAAGPAAELAAMMQVAALERTESRGAHQRSDAPYTDPAQASRRAYRFVISGTLPEVDDQQLRSLASC
ncbi:FAD-binding protein [Leucobacter insecticola]|uniref:L-aspartate oxidase n=2 Tax=Leucobacter insecticola TaxID=2714934 RepID=A0A6G8FM53_9MICO|nr:FAD-binding protein [Leucobacter insecticola]